MILPVSCDIYKLTKNLKKYDATDLVMAGHMIHVTRTVVPFFLFTCSELKNVANELSQEFMRNILSVTNNTDEDDDDITLLERYLLAGRGWMLLYAIHRIGVQVIIKICIVKICFMFMC